MPNSEISELRQFSTFYVTQNKQCVAIVTAVLDLIRFIGFVFVGRLCAVHDGKGRQQD